jgi:hypothetical protein
MTIEVSAVNHKSLCVIINCNLAIPAGLLYIHLPATTLNYVLDLDAKGVFEFFISSFPKKQYYLSISDYDL